MSANLRQRTGERIESVVQLHRLRSPVEVNQQRAYGAHESMVIRDASAKMRKRRAFENTLNPRRINVNRAIPKWSIRSGAAVMGFVRVQNYGIVRAREPGLSAIFEGLNATQRDAEGVSIVTVRRKRGAPETSLDAIRGPGGVANPPVDPSFIHSPTFPLPERSPRRRSVKLRSAFDAAAPSSVQGVLRRFDALSAHENAAPIASRLPAKDEDTRNTEGYECSA